MTESSYNVLNYIWIGIAVCTFLYLLFKKTAPYGRHTSNQWGPMISNRVGWIIMEVFVLVVLFTTVFLFQIKWNNVLYYIIGLFTLHYINRSLIFPFRIRTKDKKMPLIIALSAMLFNLMNGFLFGYYFAKFSNYSADWFISWQFTVGSAIFFIGFIINTHSDTILIHLRKPDETGYKIPMKGLFNYVSCPNLFGECIEWLGFAILCWSIPGVTFLIWTLANLVPRAIAHHKWYHEKFIDYPKDRKVLIPYIF